MFPEENKESIIFQILQIPFEYFKNFNKLTTKNFELIFKKHEQPKNTVFDPQNHNPLIEHVAFLRLLFDHSLI